MHCDIVIRSYWRDLDWLELCLAAIEQYSRGFSEIIVVVPDSSRSWLEKRFILPLGVRLEYCHDYEDDYFGQQLTKLYADTYSEAELICHVDSDCIFHQRVTPDDLAPGGRPIIYTRATRELPRRWPWTTPTSHFLGWLPEMDFMQQPPFTFPRWIYSEVRNFCERTKGCTLEQWVSTQPARGFSEFNVLGAFAYQYYRKDFEWIDVTQMWSEAKYCHWFWSWERVSRATRRSVLTDIARAQG